jgi:hypothetical protein
VTLEALNRFHPVVLAIGGVFILVLAKHSNRTGVAGRIVGKQALQFAESHRRATLRDQCSQSRCD